MRPRFNIAVRLVAIVVLGACSSGGGKGSSVSAAEGAHFVQHQLSMRAESVVSTPPWYRTLDEALPNVTYLRPDRGPATVTDLVVVGKIVDVEKGRGFVVHGNDAPDGIPSDFNAKNARWWTVHATVAVERTLGSTETPEQVTVSLPLDFPKEFDTMAGGLKGLGRVAFFLDKDSPLGAYDPSVTIVIESHALIATVAGDGTLALPFIDQEKASKLLSGVPRLADLEGRARQPRTIPLATGPGHYVRTL